MRKKKTTNKYNFGDIVWFIENNRVAYGMITGIFFDYDGKYHNQKNYIEHLYRPKYRIDKYIERCIGINSFSSGQIDKNECEIFSSEFLLIKWIFECGLANKILNTLEAVNDD